MIKAETDYAEIIPNQLYYGNKIIAMKDDELAKIGITAILDTIHYKSDQEPIKHSDNFKFLHLDVEDTVTNSIENDNWVETGAKFIDEELGKNGKVYVHCSQGISRSSIQIMYYLMTRKKMTFKEAFDFIRSKRNVACPTLGFMKGLSELDKKLYGKISLAPEEYALMTLGTHFSNAPKEDIVELYKKAKAIVEEKKEYYDKKAQDEKIEPVGYICFDLLKEKYGKPVERFGCSEHHPFD